MNARLCLVPVLAISLVAPAFAAPPLALYPERIGAETARFYRGNAAVILETPSGSIEIRPMPVENGRIQFAIAVYNKSGRPANVGTENVSATLNGLPVPVPSYEQLADQAQQKARNAKIGAALFTGVLAGVASTASNHGTAYRHVGGPRGGYTQAIHWHDDTPGIVGATAAVAGGAMVIHGIDKKLDYTLDQLGGQVLKTTTVDPGSTFGGMVVVPTGKHIAYPAQIRLTISFNGVSYPFAFRLTPSGTDVPPPLPATAQAAAMPYSPEQPPVGPMPVAYPVGR
jgi:hypothetical protein